jgi:hypothetical protein
MQCVFLSNAKGDLAARRLRDEPVKNIKSHAIRKLYVHKREAFYEALLGPGTLVPEGEFDYHWLRLLQQLAECSEDEAAGRLSVAPVSIVPTQDSVGEVFPEVARLRPDAVPVVDGDPAGEAYLATLAKAKVRPAITIQWGSGAAIECVAAWALEPALTSPGPQLKELLLDPAARGRKALQNILCDSHNKKTREIHEALVWEAIENPACAARATDLFNDIAAIFRSDEPKNSGWKKVSHSSGLTVWVAGHIRKE